VHSRSELPSAIHDPTLPHSFHSSLMACWTNPALHGPNNNAESRGQRHTVENPRRLSGTPRVSGWPHLAGEFAQSSHYPLVHACAVRDAENVVLAHLVVEPLGSLRRWRGCDGTVNGVLLTCETVAMQTSHRPLTILAETTARRRVDAVSAKRCDDLGRSVWSSLGAAGALVGHRRRGTRPAVRAAAPRHSEQHERKRDSSHVSPRSRPVHP
jgi:hypothetical protein